MNNEAERGGMVTCIEHAWVLTMDGTDYPDGYVLVRGKRIEAVGSGTYDGLCDERVNAQGGLLLPGFVNTHCHVSMIPFRTMGDDCPDRLKRFLFPLENEAMTRELVYWGALFGMGEMLLAGITTFADMYYEEDEVARACLEAGMRGYLGETIIGQPTCDSNVPYGGFALAERMLTQYAGNERIHPIVAPHGTTTCDAAALRRAHELAVTHDTLLTLHASEMDDEMRLFARQGTTPTEYLHALGLVDTHLLAAHCIHMTPEDIACMAQGGARVAHCIGSNTKAGKGVAPIAALRAAGVSFGLGTDGASSGNTLSLFDQMRLFAAAHKTANHDRSLFPAREIVEAATLGGARALRGEQQYGRIAPGLRADLVLVSTRAAHMFPVYNPYSALVYGANASDVMWVMADGVVRVQNGQLVDMDMERVRAQLTRCMPPFLRSAARYSDII